MEYLYSDNTDDSSRESFKFINSRGSAGRCSKNADNLTLQTLGKGCNTRKLEADFE